MSVMGSNIVDEICKLCIESSKDMSWLVEPLTMSRARAYTLQHILRNRFLSAVIRPAWVSRCPDLSIVRKTIVQMQQELVYYDAIKRSHTDLLYELGRNIGLSDVEMDSATPVPLVEAAFNIWENLARNRHWIIGWLASSVGEYIITTVPHNNFRAAQWKQSLGLKDEDVFFFGYHEKADKDHAGCDIWEPIAKYASDEKIREDVLAGTGLALEALKLYYRGVADLGDAMMAAPKFVTTPKLHIAT